MVRGSPCMCIRHTPTPRSAAHSRAPGARSARTSLTMQAPAATAAVITSGLLVSMEIATSNARRDAFDHRHDALELHRRIDRALRPAASTRRRHR